MQPIAILPRWNTTPGRALHLARTPDPPDSGAAPPGAVAPVASGAPGAAPGRPAFPPLPVGIEDDWAPVLLCVALAAFFVVLGLLRESALAYATAGLFSVLVLVLMAMNMTARRIG